jgi:transcription elongation factor Elf1
MNRTDHIKLNWFHKTLNCHNCGHHEDLPLPLPVTEASERINEFSIKHQDCPKQAMLDLDEDGDTVPWKSKREIELEAQLAASEGERLHLQKELDGKTCLTTCPACGSETARSSEVIANKQLALLEREIADLSNRRKQDKADYLRQIKAYRELLAASQQREVQP